MKRLVAALIVALMHVSVAAAGDDVFRVGWFDWMPEHPPSEVARAGCDVVLTYNNGSIYDDRIQAYLDSASESGVDVILDVRTLAHNGRAKAGELAAFAKKYGGHPALIGWYIADEPYQGPVAVEDYKAAYDALSQNSDKPVSMAFNEGDILFKHIGVLGDAHDLGLVLDYRINETHSELPRDRLDQWKERMDLAVEQERKLGKPFWVVLPAYGANPKYPTWNWRLLTADELRFMSTYAIVEMDAKGILFWALAVARETVARPELPYPQDGNAWMRDVGVPLCDELNLYAGAIGAGPITDGVTNDCAAVKSRVYRDPDSGIYYLLTVNTSSEPLSVTFRLSLPETFGFATPVNEDQTPSQKVAEGVFSDEFTPYEAHNYQLIH